MLLPWQKCLFHTESRWTKKVFASLKIVNARPTSISKEKTPFQSYYMSQSDSLYPSYSSLHCCFCAPVLPTCPNRCAGCWGDDLCLANQKVSCLIRPENQGVSNSFYYKFSQLTKTSLWFLSFSAFQVTLGLGLAHGVVGLRHLAVHGALPKLGFLLSRWHSWRYFIGFPFIKMFTFF